MNASLSSYEDVISFMYEHLPMFQRQGGSAYKKDLTNTIKLCEALGHPESKFKSIHVAGTNGKGSSSHFLASILQEAGYKTGLYTSPHLKSFTERIRINGQEISPDEVVGFVNRMHDTIVAVSPSFFELTVAMAFDHFVRHQVDVAVIEVGMGGRLDSTNVITPDVSLITNIDYDHMQWLGDTLPQIAREKAGIIKSEIPVVISEYQEGIAFVFEDKAEQVKAPLIWAKDEVNIQGTKLLNATYKESLQLPDYLTSYQKLNILGVVASINQLRSKGYSITKENIQQGIANMHQNTGQKGRWQVLGQEPLIICDVGHNEAGVRHILHQFSQIQYKSIHIVWGTVSDKDLSKILDSLPLRANYYFCKPDIPRGMEVQELLEKAEKAGLNGKAYPSVVEAIVAAKEAAKSEDLIFIGGSTFVVAEIPDL